MVSENMTDQKRVLHYAFLTIVWSALLIVFFINPIWTRLDLHVPGESHTKVDFTQLVDSIFYIRNAELGYRWNLPTSIWFHPVIAWAIDLMPAFIVPNFRFWILSLLAGIVSLVLLDKYIKEISSVKISPWMFLLIPLFPGGLGLATSNAEIPCLVFVTLTLLSVLRKQNWYLPVLWGALAILTKPNAVYAILGIIVYFIWGKVNNDFKMKRNSILGIAGILFAWAIWFLYVDFSAGNFGAYWTTREKGATMPLIEGVFSFFNNAVRVLLYSKDYGDSLKYLTALAVPMIDIWILQLILLRSEAHRLSMLFCVLSVLIVAMIVNNPNKIIVYVTTIPSHFAIGLLFIRQAFDLRDSAKWIVKLVRVSAGISYLMFCILMAIFYIIGTPLVWYY